MKNALTTLAALGLILLMIGLAFGAEAPEFPFKSTHQVSAPAPGITVLDTQPGTCAGQSDGLMLVVDVNTVQWVLYFMDGRVVGAVYGEAGPPLWLYFGTYNQENQRITIQSVEAFDPTKHTSPCSWLRPEPA